MPLCNICRDIDFCELVKTCIEQCKYKQNAIWSEEGFSFSDIPHISSVFKHHADIFDVKEASRTCNLCRVIFGAFLDSQGTDPEDARGLQIMFRAVVDKIEVSYKAEEELIILAGLNFYMNETNGEHSI